MIRSFDGKKPKIHKTAFVHPAAEVIGAVTIGPEASVWPGAVLRGDVDRIVVGARSNVQDNSVLHCREGEPCLVGKGVTVGHRVTLHGCRVGDGCLIGMGSTVMEARIGKESLVAAGSVVLAGMKVGPRALLMGSPARPRRKLSDAEAAELKKGEASYLRLSRLHRETSAVLERPVRGLSA